MHMRRHKGSVLLWFRSQEIKTGEQDRTRALFERTITLQLPSKKMKVEATTSLSLPTTFVSLVDAAELQRVGGNQRPERVSYHLCNLVFRNQG